MAIKGKGKTKNRQVARAPRRAPVEVPKPIYQRTWVRVVTAFLLGVLAVLLIVWITNALRASSAEDDAAAAQELRRQALTTWRGELEGQLGTVGTLQDALPPVLAPQIAATAEALAKGKDAPGDTAQLEQLAKDLDAAATALDDFDLTATIRDQGFNVGQTEALLASRTELVVALRDLEQAANLLVLAGGTTDPATVEALAGGAQALTGSAGELVDEAWRRYRNALVAGGLAQSQAAGLGLQP